MTDLQVDILKRLAGLGLGMGAVGAGTRAVLGAVSNANPRYAAPKPAPPIVVDVPYPVPPEAAPGKIPVPRQNKPARPAHLEAEEALKQASGMDQPDWLKAIPFGLGDFAWRHAPDYHSFMGGPDAQTAMDVPLTYAAAPVVGAAGLFAGYKGGDKLVRAVERRRARHELDAARREYQDAVLNQTKHIYADSKFAADVAALLAGAAPADPHMQKAAADLAAAYAAAKRADDLPGLPRGMGLPRDVPYGSTGGLGQPTRRPIVLRQFPDRIPDPLPNPGRPSGYGGYGGTGVADPTAEQLRGLPPKFSPPTPAPQPSGYATRPTQTPSAPSAYPSGPASSGQSMQGGPPAPPPPRTGPRRAVWVVDPASRGTVISPGGTASGVPTGVEGSRSPTGGYNYFGGVKATPVPPPPKVTVPSSVPGIEYTDSEGAPSARRQPSSEGGRTTVGPAVQPPGPTSPGVVGPGAIGSVLQPPKPTVMPGSFATAKPKPPTPTPRTAAQPAPKAPAVAPPPRVVRPTAPPTRPQIPPAATYGGTKPQAPAVPKIPKAASVKRADWYDEHIKEPFLKLFNRGATEAGGPVGQTVSGQPTSLGRLLGSAFFPGQILDETVPGAAALNAGVVGISGLGAGYAGYQAARGSPEAQKNRKAVRDLVQQLDREDAEEVPSPVVARLVPTAT